MIGFQAEFSYAIDGNSRGKATIDSLGLNDYGRSLPESRLTDLQRLKTLHQTVLLAAKQPNNAEFQKLAEDAKRLLEKATQDDAEFTSASRWAIRTEFQFVIG